MVDGLLAQQASRIRRAGGTPWNVAINGNGSDVGANGDLAPQLLNQPAEKEEEIRPVGESTSALETRMPEQEDAEFAQTLEAALEDFPPRDQETGQVAALPVSLFDVFFLPWC